MNESVLLSIKRIKTLGSDSVMLHNDALKVVEYLEEIESSKIDGKIMRAITDSRLVDFAKWYAHQQAEFHACTTGDCPHELQQECSEGMVRQFIEERRFGLQSEETKA